jgi:hypothetical protein
LYSKRKERSILMLCNSAAMRMGIEILRHLLEECS